MHVKAYSLSWSFTCALFANRDAVTMSSTEALLQCVVSLAGVLQFEEFLPSLRSCGIKVMPALEERQENQPAQTQLAFTTNF